jgi:hypothetical protein
LRQGVQSLKDDSSAARAEIRPTIWSVGSRVIIASNPACTIDERAAMRMRITEVSSQTWLAFTDRQG